MQENECSLGLSSAMVSLAQLGLAIDNNFCLGAGCRKLCSHWHPHVSQSGKLICPYSDNFLSFKNLLGRFKFYSGDYKFYSVYRESCKSEIMSATAILEEIPTDLLNNTGTGISVISPKMETACCSKTSGASINPWHKNIKRLPPGDFNSTHSSFRDLMSEDLANDLQNREDERFNPKLSMKNEDPSSTLLQLESPSDTSSDLTLAYMLQQQYYKEYDSQIQREEQHLNKNSKLSISFNKYKVCPEMDDLSSDDDYDYDLDDENRALDSFEERQRNDPVIPPCGYIRHNNEIITKHDRNISGRKNAERVMNFPPGINTGDGGGFAMEISNSVFNKLQRTAQAESKRKQRVKDKSDKAITDKVLDPQTRLIVFKLVNNSILEMVNGIISTGKESVVFHAQGGVCDERTVPEECAIKVFKSTLTDFKTRERYIRNDYRFKDRLSKNNNKMMIQLWAEKEFHNLRRLQKAGIPSPTPVLIKKHVLVMSFIGENQIPAPQLKHAQLSFADWCIAYEQIIDIMIKMFKVCKLVHGDLSEFNILWHKEQCWFIDLSQAVEPQHPQALRFLLRDCSNIIKFFKRKGLQDLQLPLQLFEKITGISFAGREEEAERLVEEYEINQELWREGLKSSSDHFEYLWKEINRDEVENQPEDVETDNNSNVEKKVTTTEDMACRIVCTKNTESNSKKKKNKKKRGRQLIDSSEGEDLVSDISKLNIVEVPTVISNTADGEHLPDYSLTKKIISGNDC